MANSAVLVSRAPDTGVMNYRVNYDTINTDFTLLTPPTGQGWFIKTINYIPEADVLLQIKQGTTGATTDLVFPLALKVGQPADGLVLPKAYWKRGNPSAPLVLRADVIIPNTLYIELAVGAFCP